MDARVTGIISALEKETARWRLPSVSAFARHGRDPFLILISCILSLRTRDKTAVLVSERLFREASTPEEMSRMSPRELEKIIYSANFYRNKAASILASSRQICVKYGGKVPADREELLTLPGVGRKTANLVLGLGFGIPAVCVDTHVHRISNRLGWVRTRSPEDTEKALERVLDRKHWIRVNELLVMFGQNRCFPARPLCAGCPLDRYCPKKGVDKPGKRRGSLPQI